MNQKSLVLLSLVTASCASPDVTLRQKAREANSPAAAASVPPGAGVSENPTATPEGVQGVLVELFSSEGCSSCPPADTLLRTLDKDQSIAGAHVIALEFHVDYWNRLGWTDPFSSAEYTQRQYDYNKSFGKRGVYTPQMIVDGQTEFVGSSSRDANKAITAAATTQHLAIALARNGLGVTIAIAPQETSTSSEVWAAEVERELSTDVLRGENAGKQLMHGPVVRTLAKVGITATGAAYSARLAAPTLPNRSLIVFAIDGASRKVQGAAELR
jgi:hypothetical protein